MGTIRMRVRNGTEVTTFDMPIVIMDSVLFGLLKKVKPPSAQSSVYGRRARWVWFWQIK